MCTAWVYVEDAPEMTILCIYHLTRVASCSLSLWDKDLVQSELGSRFGFQGSHLAFSGANKQSPKNLAWFTKYQNSSYRS